MGGWRRDGRGTGGEVHPRPRSAVHRLARACANRLCGPSSRALTEGEVAVLRGVFGERLDLRKALIVDGPGRNPDAMLALDIGGNLAIAEGDVVYVHRARYVPDFSQDAASVNLLVHEFTHVWQYQCLGFRRFFARYAVDIARARNRSHLYDHWSRDHAFAHETIEGQAQIVGDYAGHRAGDAALTPFQASFIERKLEGTGLFGL